MFWVGDENSTLQWKSSKRWRGKGAAIQSKNRKFNLRNVLRYLGKNNVSQLLVEGGGQTAFEFLRSHLVDEITFFMAPLLLGGRNAHSPVDGVGFPTLSKGIQAKNISTAKFGNDILIKALLS